LRHCGLRAKSAGFAGGSAAAVAQFINKINQQKLEKDYWIMHAVFGLKQLGLTFELKGGTSFSKGFGVHSSVSRRHRCAAMWRGRIIMT
jgi:hypothetical protein